MSRRLGVRGSRSPPRRWWARLVLLLGSIGLSLLLAEGALRLLWAGEVRSEDDLRRRLEASREAELAAERGFSLFGLVRPSDHPDVVYELKPGLAGRFRNQPLVTNRAGLRERRDYPLVKGPGVFRIVGLGDSVMFGWGVDQDEAYLELLEERLNRVARSGQSRFLSAEVLNCAVPGYNTTMEVALFEHKCGAFDPDLVIVHVIGNDFRVPHFLQPLEARSTGRPRSYLWSLLTAVVAPRSIEPDLLRHDIRHLPKDERLAIRGQYTDRAGAAGMRAALDKLAKLARAAGIPVLLLLLDGEEVREVALERAAAHGFLVADAAGRFLERLEEAGAVSENTWREAYVIPRDGHPTARAHELYAEVLFETVTGLELWSGVEDASLQP